MTKVELYLDDPQEFQWFQQFLTALYNYRQQKYAAAGDERQPQDAVVVPPAAPQPAEPAPAPAPAGPTKAELEAALHASLKARGLAATRAIIQQFGTGAKKATDISEDFWPELIEMLNAPVEVNV